MDALKLWVFGFQVKDIYPILARLLPLGRIQATLFPMTDSTRIDKWLWAVRVFKTRGLSTDACKAGHVKIEGKSVKPAHAVRIGEIISAYTGHHTRTVKVTGIIDKRVGAKVLPEYIEDRTPKEELERKTNASLRPISLVVKGKPSRKDREAIERIKGQL